MDPVVRVVERIRSIPEAVVGRNFGQGREAVLAQVELQLGKPDEQYVDQFIAMAQEALENIRTQVIP